MKTIIKNHLLTALLFSSFVCFSQTGSNQILERTTIKSFNLQSENLVGTSYIIDDFLPAKLIDGEEIYLMRYDAYKDVFEVNRDGEIFYYLPKTFDYPITFVDDKKVYQVYLLPNNKTTASGFFVVLNTGKKVNLLLKEKINFEEEVKAKSELDKYKPPTLKRETDTFFIGFKDNTSIELPRRKKDFFKIFSNKSNEVESFVKKQKLNFKKKEDLIQIFTYYNSL